MCPEWVFMVVAGRFFNASKEDSLMYSLWDRRNVIVLFYVRMLFSRVIVIFPW